MSNQTWKKYGGINKPDMYQYLTVSTLVADQLFIRNLFTIYQTLHVTNNAIIDENIISGKNINAGVNINASGDINAYGNLISYHNAYIYKDIYKYIYKYI